MCSLGKYEIEIVVSHQSTTEKLLLAGHGSRSLAYINAVGEKVSICARIISRVMMIATHILVT